MLKQRIKAEGLLPNELETAIADALKSEQLIVDPFVTITIAEYHSRPISVAGSVKNPITFQAYGTVTVLDALTRAGGLSDTAGAEILLSRSQTSGGQTQLLTQRIPVKGLIDMADPDLNVRLHGGEEIRVPEAGRIYVVGNVKKPGSFPIKENTETSVLKALAQAEGLTPYSQKIAYIYRREGGSGTNKNEIPIELKQIMDRKSPDVTLIANDVLYIPDNARRRTTITALDRVLMFGAGAATALIYVSAYR
jgi:polysaccharide export outer membrane protein